MGGHSPEPRSKDLLAPLEDPGGAPPLENRTAVAAKLSPTPRAVAQRLAEKAITERNASDSVTVIAHAQRDNTRQRLEVTTAGLVTAHSRPGHGSQQTPPGSRARPAC
eukprot:353466-Chlamydomonas_euryale.AAC.2